MCKRKLHTWAPHEKPWLLDNLAGWLPDCRNARDCARPAAKPSCTSAIAPAPWFSRLLPPLAAAMVAEPAAEQTTGFMSISIDTVAQEAQNARGRKCVCACDIMLKKPQTLNAWSHCSYGTRRWYNESRSFCDTEGPFNHDSLESEVPHDDADINDILSMM